MNAKQQKALESLIDRKLTNEECTALDSYIQVRDDVSIANLLPKKKVLVSTPIGIGTILAVLAPNGGAFLEALDAAGQLDPNVKWALRLIEQSNFDVGMLATRTQMKAFALAAPQFADGIALLLTLAEQEECIHYNNVSDVLNIAEERLTL